MARFAVKRLAAVEIEPAASHQRELNAGALRTGLGLPAGRTEGELSVLCYLDPDTNPVLLEGEYTLYDARENHPNRSEYRLYYRLAGLAAVARPDDLVILCRPGRGTELQGIVARPGTAMERRLERLLELDDRAALRRLVVREVGPANLTGTDQWVGTLFPEIVAPTVADAVQLHPLHSRAVSERVVPATRQMAEAGRDLAGAVWPGALDADAFITRGLEAESELYFAIERDVGTLALNDLLQDGTAELDQMLGWAMRIQQSRKSRRGQSLQHHFSFLLDREEIPYTAQCRTEGKERPDFVVPGQEQYHDRSYPAARLRMVACKSTVRERWGQILKEAERIPEKYLLTIDEGMSDDVIRILKDQSVRVFVPSELRTSGYGRSSVAKVIGTVGDLLRELRRVL